MFLAGGVLKLLGDLVNLVGPLSINHIVEYIQNKNLNNNATLNNVSVNGTTSTIIFDGDIIIFDDNNAIVDDVFNPTWNDFLSNGWIFSIIVLISSLAQATLSQGSTHMVNMAGIRLKTAIQGLVYRKTLMLSSSCFHKQFDDGLKDGGNKMAKSNSRSEGDENGGEDELCGGGVGINSENENGGCCIEKTGKHKHYGDDNEHDEFKRKEKQHKVDNNDDDGNGNDNISRTDAGTITNLMSDDALNIMTFFWIGHYVWAIPLKVI